jgi:predicted permease
MFVRVATIVLPIFAIVALGYLYARRKQPQMAAVNQINMDVFIPALIFYVLSRREFSLDAYVDLALAGIVVVLGSGLLAYPVARKIGCDWRTFVPPMMFTNYGNLGLPLFVFAFGDSALSAAVVLFIAGNFLHFSLGRYLLDHSLHPLELLRSPILLASIIGLLFSIMRWHLPPALAIPIEMLGQVSIPLLLFSLGVRLIDIDWRDWRLGLIAAVVCPAVGLIMAVVAAPLFTLGDLQTRQLLLFGALPPAVLNFLFAEQFNQEPGKVASIVMIGNLSSVLVIPLMLALLLRPA